jgi:hypothetical protein
MFFGDESCDITKTRLHSSGMVKCRIEQDAPLKKIIKSTPTPPKESKMK